MEYTLMLHQNHRLEKNESEDISFEGGKKSFLKTFESLPSAYVHLYSDSLKQNVFI